MLQGTPLDQLDRKHFPKGHQAPTSMKSEKEMAQQVSLSKDIAFAEVKMQKLCELLLEVLPIICACVSVSARISSGGTEEVTKCFPSLLNKAITYGCFCGMSYC